MRQQCRNLSIRMKGEDVKLLQGRLQQHGYALGEDADKHFFGKATREAVIDFQKKHGLESTGIADTKTVTLLDSPAESGRMPQASLSELSAKFRRPLSGKLLKWLSGQGINTLSDIRRAGGLSRMDMPDEAERPAMQELEAHANLDVLTPHLKIGNISGLELNSYLIDKGFMSVPDITNVPRSVFVDAVREKMGNEDASLLHNMACAQTGFLKNVLAGLMADSANGYSAAIDKETTAYIRGVFGSRCECKDCESAASPLAYLADLLHYALTHLKKGNAPITLQDLSDIYHQPFKDLPASCEAMNKQVHQVRICIDVLRDYFKTVSLSPVQYKTIELAEKEYKLETYRALLGNIGTSYEEIRLARRSSPESRKAIAERIGIDLDPALSIVVAGDFDGDGYDEIAVSPKAEGENGLIFKVMKYDHKASAWARMGTNTGLSVDAEFICSVDGVSFRQAATGDFDGDGQDEIAIMLGSGSYMNAFRVMKYDKKMGLWAGLTGAAGHKYGEDFTCCSEDIPAMFFIVGDFDGDKADEIVVAAGTSLANEYNNMFWAMKFDRGNKSWKHMNVQGSLPFSASFKCTSTGNANANYGAKFAVASDFDGDGRDEIAIAPDAESASRNAFWVMKYDAANAYWKHLSPIAGHLMEADFDCQGRFFAKYAVAGNFDGNANNRHSIAIAQDWYNNFWVMAYDAVNKRWNHVSLSGNRDFDCSLRLVPTRFAIVGDFDGDKIDEIAIAPEMNGRDGNSFWVMKYDKIREWVHLSRDDSSPLGIDLSCSTLEYPALDGISGKFYGSQDEILAIPGSNGTGVNAFWALRYDKASNPAMPKWCHVSWIFDHPLDADVEVGGRPDQLDMLFLDATVKPLQASITEEKLERMFGVADTTRFPLSGGVKQADPDGLVLFWELSGVEWKRNTDEYGVVYLSLKKSPAPKARLYADRNRTRQVASGEQGNDGIIYLTEDNGSGLYGLLSVSPGDANSIELCAIPLMQCWRLKHLRKLWKGQDLPVNPYVSGSLPVIDPDLIGADDFRYPFVKTKSTDADRAYDIWLARRRIVDKIYGRLRGYKDVGVKLGLEKYLEAVWGGTMPDLMLLQSNLSSGKDLDDTVKQIKSLGFTLESFDRLVSLLVKDKSARAGNTSDVLADDEWTEIFSILTQAKKAGYYPSWVFEEREKGVLQGPHEFWFPLSEPVEGEWPSLLPAEVPMIDPDALKIEDMPESTSAKRAKQLWKARRKWLDSQYEELDRRRRAGGLEAIFKDTFGDALAARMDDINAVLTAGLPENDPAYIDACATIRERFLITVEDFSWLMVIKSKDKGSKISDSEWHRVYVILAQVLWKKLPAGEKWWEVERNMGINYQDAFKCKLPRWRVGADDRSLWREALNACSKTPLIDPDLVLRGDLKDLSDDDTAHRLWEERGPDGWIRKIIFGFDQLRKSTASAQAILYAMIVGSLYDKDTLSRIKASLSKLRISEGLLEEVRETFDVLDDPLAVIDNLSSGPADARRSIAKLLGMTREDFALLTQAITKARNGTPMTQPELDKVDDILAQAGVLASLWSLNGKMIMGHDSAARLEQLSLNSSSYQYLSRIHDLTIEDNPILDSEWSDAYDILIQAQKRRIAAIWRKQEREKIIAIGPDHFTLDSDNPAPGTVKLPAWRATWNDRFEWLDTLRSRIDLEGSTADSLAEWILRVEEVTLPKLRDALIRATDEQEPSLSVKAKRVTDTFFIDAESSGCTKTTRIAQAIETVQSVIWAIKTRQFSNEEMTIDADNFDEEWKWIGSYGPWRAAILMLLYPENILLPSLRSYQTPAFNSIVNSYKRITPQEARKAGAEYTEYLRDVGSMVIDATCIALTKVGGEEYGRYRQSDYRKLYYLFGHSGDTGKAFWSCYDPEDTSSYPQSPWTEVTAFKDGVERLIGAVPFDLVNGKQHIYLYALVNNEGRLEIAYARYDPLSRAWVDQDGAQHMDPPGSKTDMGSQKQTSGNEIVSAAVMQSAYSYHNVLFVQTKDAIYSRACNNDGTGWSDYSGVMDLSSTAVEYTLAGAMRPGTDTYLVVSGLVLSDTSSSRFKLYYFRPVYDKSLTDLGNCHLLGTMVKGNSSLCFVWDYPSAGNKVIELAGAFRTNHTMNGHPGFERLAAHCGINRSGVTTGASDLYATRYFGQLATFNPDGYGMYSLDKVARVVPDLYYYEYMTISDQLTDSERAERQGRIGAMFGWNSGGSHSIANYLEEESYFLPMYLGLQLQASGEYAHALDWFRLAYDYTLPADQRKIFCGLNLAGQPVDYNRAEDWLDDVLDPHKIAATRNNAYLRYTLMSIVGCLLDYADEEFTQDSKESVSRARILYNTALKLLDQPELKQAMGQCEELIGTLDVEIGGFIATEAREYVSQWNETVRELRKISDYALLKTTVDGIRTAVSQNGPWSDRMAKVGECLPGKQPPRLRTMNFILKESADASCRAYSAILKQARMEEAAGKICDRVSAACRTVYTIAPPPGSRTPATPLPAADASTLPLNTGLNTRSMSGYIPVIYSFCVLPNPLLKILRLRADTNLFKIRNCRNIAGMQRQLEPYAAATEGTSGMPVVTGGYQLTVPNISTIKPTIYRYSFLIERAKQLVNIAQKIEEIFISYLEKYDAATYNVFKARQDIRLAYANVQLQDLRVREANDRKTLTGLQKKKIEFQQQVYDEWIKGGMNEYEKNMIDLINSMADSKKELADDEAMYQMYMRYVSNLESWGFLFCMFWDIEEATQGEYSMAGLQKFIIDDERWIQINSIKSGFYYRKQEWQMQKDILGQDSLINAQQETIDADNIDIATQESAIARIQVQNYEAGVDFLNNMFMNAELYAWMSNVLEGVYKFFMQQATSVAMLASSQLSFERQEAMPPFIQANYWSVPAEGTITASSDDKRGLTGSARLLRDIYQLDEYAIETGRRKHQITKNISLAQLAPYEFELFRKTGVISFNTPMSMFDRDFPGHYLRLVKQVKVTVIGLIPPTKGIKATLTSSGISRVVIGGDMFRTVIVRRDQESVALCSPVNASGLFPLEPQSQEMMLPFEGTGVDTSWEFSMPKAANQFDYDTIADVLITIDYTSLSSPDYRQQVIQQMGRNLAAYSALSFKHQLADQWYELNNPDQSARPMAVSFNTARKDFPLNIDDLRIQDASFYFICPNGTVPDDVINITFSRGTDRVEVETKINNGFVASAGAKVAGKDPTGTWELLLPDSEEMRDQFKNEDITDIIFVIAYAARMPEWP